MNPAIAPFVAGAALLLQACATGAPAAHAPQPPPSAADLFARGMQLAEHGDALRAEQYLLLSMRAGYPEQRVIVPLVRVCVASSRLRVALGHALHFLRRRPEAVRLRYLTAAIHLALDQPDDAVRELRRIVHADPDAAQAHYLMGIALRDGHRDPRAARASFEQYLRLAPRGPHARETLAWLAEQPAAAGVAPRATEPRPAENPR